MMTQNSTTQFKLTIELVPKTSWYDNLRKAIPKSKWDELRKQVYDEYGHKCGICKAEGKLSCHELWQYDDDSHEQKLLGFIALCDWCHHVKHIGLAGILAKKGQLDYEKVIEHFLKVNACDRNAFEKHRHEAIAQWQDRSKYEWQINLGDYKDLIEKQEN